MTGSKVKSLFGLILGVALVNIVVWSPGMLGVSIGGSALETAFGATVLVLSAFLLFRRSYTVLFKPSAAVSVQEIRTDADYAAALSHYRRIKAVGPETSFALDQLERMKKRRQTLLHVLNQRFDPQELSYKKFSLVIGEVEKLFYANLRGMLNKLHVFEASGYVASDAERSAQLPQGLRQRRQEVYHQYLTIIKRYIGINEEILLKLDQLLLEIARLQSVAPADIEQMPGIKEINTLIEQTKYYRQ